jgi:hypothetical protein
VRCVLASLSLGGAAPGYCYEAAPLARNDLQRDVSNVRARRQRMQRGFWIKERAPLGPRNLSGLRSSTLSAVNTGIIDPGYNLRSASTSAPVAGIGDAGRRLQ